MKRIFSFAPGSLAAALTLLFGLGTGNVTSRAADLSEFEIYPEETVLYRAFEGTINGRMRVRVFLSNPHGRWEGVYFYENRRSPLSLTDQTEVDEETPRASRVVLFERPGFEGSESTGRWEGEFDADAGSFRGTWHSMDGSKSFPIDLKESYTSGSLPALAYQFSSSWTQARGSRETVREHSALVFQFQGDSPAVARINEAIRQAAAGCFGGGEEPVAAPSPIGDSEPVALTRRGNPFSDLEQAIRADPMDPEDMYFGLLGYDTLEVLVYPVHNEGGFVTVRIYERSYQGGAHGNYFDRHLTFEIATGRQLELERDVFKAGFEEPVARVADDVLRGYLDLEPGESLREGGLDVERIELNDNWYLTVGGIGFSYVPYEVACFAVGFVTYELPWEKVKPWLREGAPAFRLTLN